MKTLHTLFGKIINTLLDTLIRFADKETKKQHTQKSVINGSLKIAIIMIALQILLTIICNAKGLQEYPAFRVTTVFLKILYAIAAIAALDAALNEKTYNKVRCTRNRYMTAMILIGMVTIPAIGAKTRTVHLKQGENETSFPAIITLSKDTASFFATVNSPYGKSYFYDMPGNSHYTITETKDGIQISFPEKPGNKAQQKEGEEK